MQSVYLDYAATTPLSPAAGKAMLQWSTEYFGNPSSLHAFGRKAKIKLEETRDRLALILRARSSEIVFTGGGTESNNLALIGAATANKEKGRRILVGRTEHPSVIETAKHLQQTGFEIRWLKADAHGRITEAEIMEELNKDTILISVMHVNNETGIVNPVEKIAKICQRRQILFHCDAVQSFGKLSLDVNKVPVDLLTVSAHKIYGPKGVGALYVRSKTPFSPLIHGGGQEARRRAGTENMPGIAGLYEALSLLPADDSEYLHIKKLRDYFEEELKRRFPICRIIGQETERSPHISQVAFVGLPNDSLLMQLDLAGIAVSVGSACSSGSITHSRTLQAMGLMQEIIDSAVRFSYGRHTTHEELDYTLEQLKRILSK